jgi:hypothetical protein
MIAHVVAILAAFIGAVAVTHIDATMTPDLTDERSRGSDQLKEVKPH